MEWVMSVVDDCLEDVFTCGGFPTVRSQEVIDLVQTATWIAMSTTCTSCDDAQNATNASHTPVPASSGLETSPSPMWSQRKTASRATTPKVQSIGVSPSGPTSASFRPMRPPCAALSRCLTRGRVVECPVSQGWAERLGLLDQDA